MDKTYIVKGLTYQDLKNVYPNSYFKFTYFTVKEVEEFDKLHSSYKYENKSINDKDFRKHYLLRNNMWWLIGDRYYLIPKCPIYTSSIFNRKKEKTVKEVKIKKIENKQKVVSEEYHDIARPNNPTLIKAKKVGKAIVNYKGFGLIVSIVLLLIIAAFTIKDKFFTYNAFTNMLSNNGVYAILAVGVTFVLLTGGIDISVGSTLAVSAVIVGSLNKYFPQIPAFVLLLIAIAVGMVLGGFNGVLIGKLKIVPLIATLATMYIFRGLAFVITKGIWIQSHELTDSFKALSNTLILGIPSIAFFAIGILIIAGIFLALTKPGRRLYAVGTSEQSSAIAGISVGNVKISAYVLCGAIAGLAGILFASKYQVVHSEIAQGYELTAIAVCVIGGVSNTGGKGRIDCLTLGILFMAILATMLSNIKGFSIWQDACKGAIIIIAVFINIASDMMKKRREVLEMGKRL